MQGLCEDCRYYKRRERARNVRFKGYCSAYVVPTENYDSAHHIVIKGRVYSPVPSNGSCDSFEEREHGVQ